MNRILAQKPKNTGKTTDDGFLRFSLTSLSNPHFTRVESISPQLIFFFFLCCRIVFKSGEINVPWARLLFNLVVRVLDETSAIHFGPPLLAQACLCSNFLFPVCTVPTWLSSYSGCFPRSIVSKLRVLSRLLPSKAFKTVEPGKYYFSPSFTSFFTSSPETKAYNTFAVKNEEGPKTRGPK